jgi:phosphoribosylamine--glycine ligase
MKVLVVGSGGREHVLIWKLRRDHPEHEFLVTGRNGGLDDVARCVETSLTDIDALVDMAQRERIGFTVVGPEVPLAAGVVDAFRAAGLAVFGPTQAAARLESSKAFAKRLMQAHGIPTARFEISTARAPAAAFAAELGVPCVVKASGLAAGKGALVCETTADVEAALVACFDRRDFGAAADEVVVEEFLVGEEASMIALTDGRDLLPLLPSQDHKRAADGDQGPNTGGMGAYAPATMLNASQQAEIVETIFRPILSALEADGVAFSGCLYAGLVLTSTGPRVLEWNVRFGDPEAQALLPLIETDLLALLMSATPEGGLGEHKISWRGGACVTVVAASVGYPSDYETGVPIDIPSELEADTAFDRDGVVVFHAGTRRDGDRLVTAGGRVLNVTAVGGDVGDARERAYGALARIDSPALRWRSDIGWRELARAYAG